MATAVVTENFKPQGKGHTKTQSRVQLEGLRDALGTQSLEQLRGMIRTLPGLVKDDDNLRQDVLNAVKQLQAEIETPWDTIQRIFLLNPWYGVSVTIGVNMGLFRTLVDSASPLSAREIATKCEADLNFTQRLLRCLNSFNAVKQFDTYGELVYAPTNMTRTFTTPMGEACPPFITEFFHPAWLKFPAKLRGNGYKPPPSGTETVFNDIYNMPGKHVWDILATTPYIADGGVFMSQYNAAHKHWTDVYPVNQRLVEGADNDPNSVFMVDVGGWTGSVAISTCEKFPEAPGKFMVLDLPSAVASASSLPPRVHPCAHDFFKPYPAEVQGARFYFMRYISHDWNQDDLVAILTNIRNAMKPGYSRLLINDWVVPEKDPHPFMCSQDLTMMHLAGGEERSEARFRDAIERAGLQLSNIFRPGDKISESVVECRVAGEEGVDSGDKTGVNVDALV
ncbi:hypothetical protein CB0940_05793 [Cercospora beticola]|uniref:Uncharacterized protein n=1 Tax=Cercospora beticola TaxID=122368 RepID=A0A2G5HXY9_CERBT|nr:hypothetical protein CB0940_05793 [Cercospora beticola]PIA97380.1 hypothetical protein CB0940_05793 [Cercospora beticola]WPA98379.1 hypothetical protein RHO25_002991 [Cercospora beticola]CAK1359619.1 unnamed protein product [Cercospora beticola]